MPGILVATSMKSTVSFFRGLRRPTRDWPWVSFLAGMVALAAVYVYLLLFAEFAFIECARQALGEASLRPILAALAGAGIVGSSAAAYGFCPRSGARQLALGFLLCAAAAACTEVSLEAGRALPVALMVGGSLGWTSVVGALCLRPTVPSARLGLCCGLGTGLAYALCNQPLVFMASPKTQVMIALGAAGIGLLASLRMRGESVPRAPSPDQRAPVAWLWVALFLLAVWFDSAVFTLIQHDTAVKAVTWAGVWILQGNALVHLVIAVFTGLVLDRGLAGLAFGVALAALLLGYWILRLWPAAHMLYVAGVSGYSTVLIHFAAQGARPWLVGALFAISGWLGSAMGIAMAGSLTALPGLYGAATAIGVVVGLFARHRCLVSSRHTRRRHYWRP